MNPHEITPRQMTIWIAAASCAPLAHASGAGWLSVALGALAMLPLTLLPAHWDGLSKGVRAVEFVWLAAAAGLLLQNSGIYWPASQNELFVPLTLLALTVLPKQTVLPRTGAVVGLCMAVLFVPVLTGAAAQLEPGWLLPEKARWPDWLPLTLLLPALAGIHGQSQNRGVTALACAGIGIFLALITQGILSPRIAASLPDAFHQMSRSISLGVLSRMEPVAAVAITLGWYALCGFLFSGAMRLFPGNEKIGKIAFAAIAAAFVLFRVQLPGLFSLVLSLFLWVLIPGCTPKKKNEKIEK